jgi:transcriptional regulator with XRE-family HTH domain
MPDLRSSSPVKRALAAELRRLREMSGMSGDEAAAALRWSASKISRIEMNRTGVKPADLRRMLELYGADEARRRNLAELAAEPEPRGWWNAYADSIDPAYAAYVALEESAVQLWCWSPEMIHGLLQSEPYAREIIERTSGSISARTTQDRVDIRLRRQRLLTNSAPKSFTFVLDEATLLRRHGSPGVMRAQLADLNRVSELPNVTIQVLAFDGIHPVVNPGSFAILEFAQVHDTQISDVVYVERLLNSDFVENDHEAHEYRTAFERLSEAALGPGESRQLIEQTVTGHWSQAE